nr:PhoP/PhoQ regulator MgrB [Yersinia pestis]
MINKGARFEHNETCHNGCDHCRLPLVACCLLLVACCLFYLLALDSYCDQGGTFSTGICAITTIVPW